MKTLPLLLLLILIGCAKDPFLTDDSGTFKDSRDKHEYKWIRIGEQVWMTENLAYLPAVSPSSDGSVTSPFYYVYDYEGSSISEAKTKQNYTTYGVLYNWEAAKIACPSGWHLPTDAEWKILESYLGMSQSDADSDEWRESGSIGKALKFTSGWAESGNGDNSSSFAALPGGIRNDYREIYNLGGTAYFWSSSENGSDAWLRYLGCYFDGVYRGTTLRDLGLSVRCIKDN